MTRRPSPSLPDRAGPIDWRPFLDPHGPWSALVVTRSSAVRASGCAAGMLYLSVPWFEPVCVRGAFHPARSIELALGASVELALLAGQGRAAVCPAVMMDGMAQAGPLVEGLPAPVDRAFWMGWSQILLNAARGVVIPDLPGWDRCPMVWRDLCHALTYSLPVHVYGGA